ncbi:MAG: hypothetical protein EBY18_06985 [Alphaproteobacteria bacterium]|nr:hypothetical protein [Alphaproteobacteria bacterium]
MKADPNTGPILRRVSETAARRRHRILKAGPKSYAHDQLASLLDAAPQDAAAEVTGARPVGHDLGPDGGKLRILELPAIDRAAVEVRAGGGQARAGAAQQFGQESHALVVAGALERRDGVHRELLSEPMIGV